MSELNKRTKEFYIETLEQLIDKSECYVYLHNQSHNYYLLVNVFFNLTIIVLLVFCGLAILTFSKIGKESQIGYLSFLAGLIIFSAFLKIIQCIYKYQELSEFHRISLSEWRKLSRDTNDIIVKIRACDNRYEMIEFYFTFYSGSYNRMEEISPKIPDNIIVSFNIFMNIFHKKTTRPKICRAFKEEDEEDEPETTISSNNLSNTSTINNSNILTSTSTPASRITINNYDSSNNDNL